MRFLVISQKLTSITRVLYRHGLWGRIKQGVSEITQRRIYDRIVVHNVNGRLLLSGACCIIRRPGGNVCFKMANAFDKVKFIYDFHKTFSKF